MAKKVAPKGIDTRCTMGTIVDCAKGVVLEEWCLGMGVDLGLWSTNGLWALLWG